MSLYKLIIFSAVMMICHSKDEYTEIERALNRQVMLVDTREQDTKYLHYRLNQMGLPYEREALKFGDYSAKFPLPNGEWFSLADKCCIERKHDISELCANFCRSRERFEREFARASSSNGKNISSC